MEASRSRDGGRARRSAMDVLREQLSVRHAIAENVVALSHLQGRPIIDDEGARVGRVRDVVVRWDKGIEHPVVTGILARTGRADTFIGARDISISQSEVRLTAHRLVVERASRGPGDVALAADVLDHQLVDVAGVQVVRAADVYLVRMPSGWELAGVDVGVRAFVRRLLRRRRRCPTPIRVIDWAGVQSFVPRFRERLADDDGPATAAGDVGGGVQFSTPARQIRKLKAKEVARLLPELGRPARAQVVALAAPSVVLEVLRGLEPRKLDALLTELSDTERDRLVALLDESPPT